MQYVPYSRDVCFHCGLVTVRIQNRNATVVALLFSSKKLTYFKSTDESKDGIRVTRYMSYLYACLSALSLPPPSPLSLSLSNLFSLIVFCLSL